MALYNNGFPVTYPQMYYQPVVQQTVPQQSAPQTQNNGIIWVSGEAGAKAYLVAPNTTVQLWDSESQTIFLKSADASGMPSIKVLEYTIRDNPQAAQKVAPSQPNYATKQDLDSMYEQINALRAEIDGLTIRKATTRSRKETDDE